MTLRRAGVALLGITSWLVLAGSPALAAEPDEVAAEVVDQGFYVEDGSSATAADIGRVVSDVRSEGENLTLVVLAREPPAGATTFAGAVFERLGSSIVVVLAPETVGFDGIPEVYTDIEIQAALERAVDVGGDDAAVAATFASTLTEAPIDDAGEGGGGGAGLLWLLLLAVGVVGLFVWLAVRSRRRSAADAAGQLSKARHAVEQQMSALANDILDMEDEVRSADDVGADGFYEEAAQTYSEVSDAFPAAETPEQLIGLSNRLDTAIWQLDSAEAVLDGKPHPARPESKRLEPAARVPSPGEAGSTAGEQVQYERRPTRRSSYSGPSITDLLIVVGGAVMSGRGRSGRLSGMVGRRTPPGRTSSSGPVPTPSQLDRRTAGGERQGSGGRRVRGGKRRRG